MINHSGAVLSSLARSAFFLQLMKFLVVCARWKPLPHQYRNFSPDEPHFCLRFLVTSVCVYFCTHRARRILRTFEVKTRRESLHNGILCCGPAPAIVNTNSNDWLRLFSLKCQTGERPVIYGAGERNYIWSPLWWSHYFLIVLLEIAPDNNKKTTKSSTTSDSRQTDDQWIIGKWTRFFSILLKKS